MGFLTFEVKMITSRETILVYQCDNDTLYNYQFLINDIGQSRKKRIRDGLKFITIHKNLEFANDIFLLSDQLSKVC